MHPLPVRARNRYSLDTAGLILARDHELVATCAACDRSVVLDLAALIARRGEDWPRSRVKARCSACRRQAAVTMRPVVPLPESRQAGDRNIPLLFAASVEHMIPGDRVHYACQTCGDRWVLLPGDLLAHPLGGPSARLRDTHYTACGNCGEWRAIAAKTEWVAAP